jgi:hypothetical protein
MIHNGSSPTSIEFQTLEGESLKKKELTDEVSFKSHFGSLLVIISDYRTIIISGQRYNWNGTELGTDTFSLPDIGKKITGIPSIDTVTVWILIMLLIIFLIVVIIIFFLSFK